MFWIRKVYLDHNATTFARAEVGREMARVMRRAGGNPSSLHTVGRAAKGALETARRRVAGLLNCAPEQLVFTSGGTEGNNTVLKGVFAMAGNAGTLVTTAIEHESILGCVEQLRRRGVAATVLPAGRDGRVRLEEVAAALTPEVRLVSVMHANNETGALNPVAEIGALCRERGILFHTDAVQSFGKVPVDVAALNCDFLTVSGHKIDGPKGVGAIFMRDPGLVEPLIYGGDQEWSRRAGTENVPAIAGFGVAAKLKAASMRAEFIRLERWRREFLDGLANIFPELAVNEAPAGSQLPGTLSLTFPGVSNLTLLAGLDCYEVEAAIGSACTADRIEPSHVLLGMGHSEEYALSTLRLSAGRGNRRGDLRYVLRVLEKLLRHPVSGFDYLMPEHLTEERRREAYIVDLRWPYERLLAASLPEAHEGSPLAFERWSRKLPRDREVILLCSTGVISGLNGYKLALKRHRRVKVVYGGYNAYRKLQTTL